MLVMAQEFFLKSTVLLLLLLLQCILPEFWLAANLLGTFAQSMPH
jgi:hypothetical protein